MVTKKEATEVQTEEWVNPDVDQYEDTEFDEWEEPTSSWFKFEKIGDRITGLVVEFDPAGSDRPGDAEPAEKWSKLDLLQTDGSIVSVRMNGWLHTTLTRQSRKIIPRTTILTCVHNDTKPPRQKMHDPTKVISIKFANPGHPKYDGILARYDLSELDAVTADAGTTKAPDPF